VTARVILTRPVVREVREEARDGEAVVVVHYDDGTEHVDSLHGHLVNTRDLLERLCLEQERQAHRGVQEAIDLPTVDTVEMRAKDLRFGYRFARRLVGDHRWFEVQRHDPRLLFGQVDVWYGPGLEMELDPDEVVRVDVSSLACVPALGAG
jgi:hypothetical protein